ncbi:MAG: alpha-isopropylmalate synthase regulatory domain-containing protein, partial [Nitrospinota bacterium]
IANMRPRIHQPFVGRSAFAHKGGIHVDAVLKNKTTYEHIVPEAVGNRQRILVSDLSGKSNIVAKAREFKLDLNVKDPSVREIVNRIKELEHQGYQYEAADGSLEILMKKATGQWKKKFKVHRARVIVSLSDDPIHQFAEAVVVVGLPGEKGWRRGFSEGNGPVNALDNALRKAVAGYFPQLKSVKLVDYKVRLMENERGTGAKTHVLIESTDEKSGEKWGTVGVSENIIEASWQALIDSIDYRLHKKASDKR